MNLLLALVNLQKVWSPPQINVSLHYLLDDAKYDDRNFHIRIKSSKLDKSNWRPIKVYHKSRRSNYQDEELNEEHGEERTHSIMCKV